MASPVERVVFFDGVCNLCNGVVQFIIDRDPHGLFHFAPLQSEVGVKMLASRGVAVDTSAPDSVILVERERVFERSDAVLRIARKLTFPWPTMVVFFVVPRFVRDAVYRFVAHHRYGWFGKTNECRLPTPELRARFLG